MDAVLNAWWLNTEECPIGPFDSDAGGSAYWSPYIDAVREVDDSRRREI